MSALVTRSKCFRTIPSSYELPRFAYVHPSRCRRIRAFGTFSHNNGSPRLFKTKILNANLNGATRAPALRGSLSLSTATVSSSSSSRTRTAGFHTSSRVDLPQFKHKNMKSSFPRPKLASPSSVAPRGKSQFKSNPMPRKKTSDSWMGRGKKGKAKAQKDAYPSSSPTVPAGPRPLKRHLFKKNQGPTPKQLMEMLGRSAGPGSSIDPRTLAQVGEEMGVRQGLPGEYGAKQARKLRLKKLRREIKYLTKKLSRGYGDIPEEKARLAEARRELKEIEIRPNDPERRKEPNAKSRKLERAGSPRLGSSLGPTSQRPQKEATQSASLSKQGGRESERAPLLESLRGIVTESESREEERARATSPAGFGGVVADRGEGGLEGRSRGEKYSTMGSRDYFSGSHSQLRPQREPQHEPQLQSRQEAEPEPEPEPLSFEARRERQQSWSLAKEKEWSRVGLRSAQEQDHLPSSTSGKGRIDARSLAVLAKQAKNSRVRYSPSAWAKASGAAPRFASPTPGRLGLGGSRRGVGADSASDRERVLPKRKGAMASFEDRGLEMGHRGRRESPRSSSPHAAEGELDHDTTFNDRVRHRAADFSRNTSFGQSREVDEALSEAAEEVEFYNPAKPVTSLSPSAALQDPLKSENADAARSRAISSEETATEFTSPPLLPGFLAALKEKFGEKVKPTPIQGLSVRWVLEALGSRWFGQGQEQAQPDTHQGKPAQQEWVEEQHSILGMKDSQITSISKFSGYRQFLLAAETGSGKSIAYLLPLLQNLKLTEHGFFSTPPPLKRKPGTEPMHAPRALVLAPTHELARQLSAFAKDLCHFPDTKLRILCASVENRDNTSAEGKKEKLRAEIRRRVRGRDGWSKEGMYKGVVFDNDVADSERKLGEHGEGGPGSVEEGMKRNASVDVVVGTPLKLLEMAWGRGMERIFRRAVEASRVYTQAAAQGDQTTRMDMTFGDSRWKPELGFENIEYVVVDEADVLFDRDFEETTRLLLADIAAARGRPVPYVLVSNSSLPTSISSPTVLPSPSTPINYPFHLILTSATIPTSLNNYLAHAHPSMIRLASPRLHKLPKGLQTEYVTWSGGNKWKDVLFRLKRVWADDAMAWRVAHARAGIQDRTSTSLLEGRARSAPMGDEAAEEAALSKVVVFCNSSRRVEDLSQYFEENGVPNVAVTSGSEARRAGRSNKYLKGFLREPKSGRAGGTPPARKWGGPSWRSPPLESNEQGREAEVEDYSNKESGFASGSPYPPPLGSKATTPKEPKVLITTSLLSRGLDFSPEVKHVFIIDQPRNMIDFLHRAGRAARAGEKGKVVIFGKMRGRGSSRFRNVRGAVGRLSGR